MGVVMFSVFRAWSYLWGRTAIRLYGEDRPGNHVFITSPDLPGFSLMLRPGEHEDIAAFMKVVDEPLKAFIEAEYEADQKRHTSEMRLTGARQTDSRTYLAELCVA